MHWLDVKYLRRIFERRPDAVDDEIVHTFKKLQYRCETVLAMTVHYTWCSVDVVLHCDLLVCGM